MNKIKGTLTSIYSVDTQKGNEIGKAFSPFCFNFQQFLDLNQEEKEKVILTCISVMKKLAKVAESVDRYHQVEKSELKKFRKRAKENKVNDGVSYAYHSISIEGAVEDILSQAKSSLDIAVKILEPLWSIKLVTFGKGGDKVLDALDRNIPKTSKDRVERLKKTIKSEQIWLKIIIDERTSTQHYSNIKISPFLNDESKGRAEEYLPLMKSGQKVSEFVDAVYENLFFFLQDFIALSIESKLIGGLSIGIVNGKIGKDRELGVVFNSVV